MNKAREPPKKRGNQVYVASCSFGKDSVAQVILAHIHNEPLDLIIYSEVMFDKDISAELPEHREFIYNTAIPKFEEWGYKVEVVRSARTFQDCFYRKRIRGKNIGKYVGFPLAVGGKCDVNRDCKLPPIKQFYNRKEIKEAIQYIGIAIDEPKRLERLDGKTKISLLEKYGLSESDAKELCEKYGLLSPLYEFTKRGGCFFCPNAREGELRNLYDNHRELWERLIEMEKEPNLCSPYFRNISKEKLSDIGERFYWQDQQMTVFDYLKGEESINK